MPFKRLHSNGFEVVIYLESRESWLVRIRSGLDQRPTILGLKTNLSTAQALADRVARENHQCNENCEAWKAVAVSS